MRIDRRRFLAAGAALAPGALLAGPSCGALRRRDGTAESSAPETRFPHLRGLSEGIEPPSAAEYEERRERARRAIRDAGYDALLLESGVSMRYFTGVPWSTSERPFLFVLPPEGSPIWIVPAFEERSARERIGDGAEALFWEEHESPYRLVGEALRARREASGRIGVEPTTRLFIVDGLYRALPGLRFESASEVVRSCRMIKTAAELERLLRASEATKAALRAAAATVREGMTEAELSEAVRAAHRASGLGNPWALVLFGPNAAFPHGTRQPRSLREGDLILVDCGGALHGYQSDVTRTWAFGRASEKARRAWEAVRGAQEAARRTIRPGVPCSEPDAAARRTIESAGFGPNYRFFTHRLGHGIGLEGHEEPYLVRGNGTLLAPGMTMSNEPGVYVPGEFGIRLEDILAVTEDGCEVFGVPPHSIETPFA